jgi:hypothetical protein
MQVNCLTVVLPVVPQNVYRCKFLPCPSASFNIAFMEDCARTPVLLPHLVFESFTAFFTFKISAVEVLDYKAIDLF